MDMCIEKERLKDREKGSKGKQEERRGEEKGMQRREGRKFVIESTTVTPDTV